MTVSTTDNRFSYAGDGATLEFAFPRLFLSSGDLVVTLVDDMSGAATPQVLATDYSVTGAGEPGGGTVTFITAPPTGKTVVIYRDTALIQDSEYTTGGEFPAETNEDDHDRRAISDQDIKSQVERSVRLQGHQDATGLDLTLPDVFSGGETLFLTWGPAGLGTGTGAGGGGGGSGEVNTARNLGTSGEGLFAQKMGAELQFKELIAGTGISFGPVTSTGIPINATGGGGGGGGGVVAQVRINDAAGGEDTLSPLNYTVGVSVVLVTKNGQLLPPGDYDATSGTSIVLDTPLLAGE